MSYILYSSLHGNHLYEGKIKKKKKIDLLLLYFDQGSIFARGAFEGFTMFSSGSVVDTDTSILTSC